jgi:hypothetical protein
MGVGIGLSRMNQHLSAQPSELILQVYSPSARRGGDLPATDDQLHTDSGRDAQDVRRLAATLRSRCCSGNDE